MILLRLLLVVLIVRAIWRLLVGIVEGATAANKVSDRSKRTVSLARDPVCGTYVVRTRALVARNGGETLYFCSERCRQEHVRSYR